MTIKITVIGTRGIPDVLGGVETHCQHLYPEIVKQFNADVCVIARSPYVNYKTSCYKGVKTKSILAPKKKSLEAIVHSILASFSTLFDGSDVVHVHAIGPGLVIPLLRLLGKKVVFTHHGPDYERQKWGGFAKKILMLGEKFAVKYATEVIVISEVINDLIKRKYNRQDAVLIYNGVAKATLLPEKIKAETLAIFSLTAHNYFVAVGRLVEEKGFHDLIAAYGKTNMKMPLVIIGDTDHATAYSDALKKQAQKVPGVIMTGFLKGMELQALFSQAKVFVMPSYHEGLPIALLEALSYSLPVIVSDIPANLAIKLKTEDYFKVGNIQLLSEKLSVAEKIEYPMQDYQKYLDLYDWEKIAKQVMQVYLQALSFNNDRVN